ncbi:MAG: F0F1 ATP synthase subunit delta [Rickettsiaceae bacterium]|nr:F0F1 ATP synthase subunit delta [Rickettsiaceae bacterium]
MNQLASKFSNILINLSKDLNALKQIASNIESYTQVLFTNEIVIKFLVSPIVPMEQKLKFLSKIEEIFFTKKNKIASNSIVILVKLKKIKILREISELLNAYILKKSGITETLVVFANKPRTKQIKIVEEILVKEFDIKPQIKIKLDEGVISGFYAFFDGKMLDASLHNTFERLTDLRPK